MGVSARWDFPCVLFGHLFAAGGASTVEIAAYLFINHHTVIAIIATRCIIQTLTVELYLRRSLSLQREAEFPLSCVGI